MKLPELFGTGNIAVDLPPAPKEALLASIVRDLDGRGLISDREQVVRDVVEREKVMSTGVGNGVAIPHAYTDGVDRLVAGFYRTTAPVDFDALDKREVDLFFIILGPKESRRDHIKILARISRLLSHGEFREDLRRAADADAVINVFKRFGDR
jgi:mannitol/fructose-specific phosphotransferase system IIA component (Ntr-type)